MAIGMYGYTKGYHKDAKAAFKEASPSQIIRYMRHKEAGTVPPESSIPYTRTGVEKYRHSSALHEFKPGAKPVLPLYTTKKLPTLMKIPTGCETTQEYVKQFNSLNHYKEI